jgi:tRNA modification GTPase
MLAYTEVSIDYAEDDLPSDIFEQFKSKMEKIIVKLNKYIRS